MLRSKKALVAILAVTLILTAAPAALATGYIQWANHGRPVQSTATAKSAEQSCPSSGGAIIVWCEGSPSRVYAERIQANGNTAWVMAVAPVAADQNNPQICSDGSGGAYIVWNDYRNGALQQDVYVQHVEIDSNPLMGGAGVKVSGAGTMHNEPRIIAVSDGCFVSWNDNGMPFTRKMNSIGVPAWPPMQLCTTAANMNPIDHVSMTSGGADSAIFAWPDNRSGNQDIYANRYDNSTGLYTTDGMPICTQAAMQYEPELIFSAMGGAVITWRDARNGGSDIYGQRVDFDFNPFWTANGTPVCVNGSTKQDMGICSDLKDGAIIVWHDTPVNGDIRAQHLAVDGTVRWASEGVQLCTGHFAKYQPSIINDNFGGAMVSWYDDRNTTLNTYVQKMDAAGNCLDVQNGLEVSDPTVGINNYTALCSDGMGGGIVAWSRGSDDYLMAQRVDYTYDYYFAEGNTRTGFAEFICLGNPTADTVNAVVIAIFNDGTPPVGQPMTVNPYSRTTVYVPDMVGAANLEKDVSIKVVADRALICERPMYFNYGGAWSGGHDAMAATSPSRTWYFAEGNTLPGFQEWVCVLNPTGTVANLTFRFQGATSGAVQTAVVLPNSRASFNINDMLGAGQQISLQLDATEAVVAERSLYFNYLGMAGSLNWTGGTCVTGATQLNRAYYFAEGTTRFASNALFEEWITLQNPGGSAITVDAAYQLESGAPVIQHYAVPATSRVTIFVPAEVGFQHDVSVKLTSTADFLAERPMYFDYLGPAGDLDWTGGSCVIGAAAPNTAWYFGEGATITGFHEYLCLQNPGTSDSTVAITYYPQGAAPIAGDTITVPAGQRRTVFVNSDAGTGLQLSAGVQVTGGPPIVVERPMYFTFGTWTGGHDAIGSYIWTP